jgi:hypothetical protein
MLPTLWGCGVFVGQERVCTADDDCVDEAICRDGVCIIVGNGSATNGGEELPVDGGLVTGDAGTPPADAGAIDAGPVDAGLSDAGPLDGGPRMDGGSEGLDGGDMDAGFGGEPEAGMGDGGFVDSGSVDSGLVDSGEPDAGPPDAGMVIPDWCGGPEMVYDDFSVSMLGDAFRAKSDPGTIFQVNGGVANFTVNSGTAGPVNTQVTSKVAFTLENAQAWLEVIPSGDPNDELQPFFRLQGLDEDQYVEIRKVGTNLEATQKDTSTTGKTEPFQPTNHRHWRIRENAGTIYFETSPDNASWSEFHTYPTHEFVDVVDLVFGVDHIGSAPTSNRSISFDNLNMYQSPPLVPMDWCPAGEFFDPFLDADPDRHWTASVTGSCTISPAAGSGQVQMTIGSDGNCLYSTRRSFAVANQTVDVWSGSGAMGGTNWFWGFFLTHPWDASQPQIQMLVTPDGFLIGKTTTPVTISNPTTPYVLRIRENGDGTYNFLVSDNGITFTSLAQQQGPAGFDHARIELVLHNQDPGFSSGSRAFTQVNFPP